jgi:predicted RNA-binding protein
MNNYWLFISNISNYIISASQMIWGVEERYKSKIEKTKKGDKIIFYLIGRHIGGIFEVTSDVYFDDKKIFDGGIYPYRINIRPVKISENVHILTDSMIKNLDIFKNKDYKWKFNLMGKTIMPISKRDFEYISSKF